MGQDIIGVSRKRVAVARIDLTPPESLEESFESGSESASRSSRTTNS